MKRKWTRLEAMLIALPCLALLFMLAPKEGQITDMRYKLADKYAPTINRFQPHQNRLRLSCAVNMKNSGLALLGYVVDYDAYPPVRDPATGKGWSDLVQPNLRGYTFFLCPNDATVPVVMKKRGGVFPGISTGQWLNAHLAGMPEHSLASPSQKLMLGEGLLTTDTSYAKLRVPPQWLHDRQSPSYRHLGGANYAFADGHVKWFTPAEFQALNSKDRVFTTK